MSAGWEGALSQLIRRSWPGIEGGHGLPETNSHQTVGPFSLSPALQSALDLPSHRTQSCIYMLGYFICFLLCIVDLLHSSLPSRLQVI